MLGAADDRFELLRQVGEGSYGVVFQALDRTTDQRVAIKLMHHAGKGHDARFERESALLAELTHPSIVRYLAHGRTSQGQAWLAMEWLEGCTLEQRLSKAQLSIDEVLTLAQRVVVGLAFAAQKGIVHRDIKPGNLFLVGRECAAAKILDLGLARRADQNQQLTRTGGVVGTPLYMSPEQARGMHDIDPRSDVFSLGSVLYECLCIDRAFEGSHPVATLAKICLEEPVPIEVNARHVPARLAALVHGMLAKERSRRPSYRELALELSALLSDSGELGAQPATSTRSLERSLLRAQSEQRVLCALFVRGLGGASALEHEVAQLAERCGARREALLDGSQILLLEAHANASDQAVLSAQTALALRSLLGPRVPIALCTGRARVGSGRPLLGELIENGVKLLWTTAPGTIRVDGASAALLDARFQLSGEGPERTLERERAGGEAPRTLLGQRTRFVGRDRELSQLTLSFRECAEEQVARPVLVTAPPGAGKSRLRFELVESLRDKGDDFLLLIARGDAMRTSKQFGLLVPAVHAWSGIASEDSLALKQEKLRAQVASLVPAPRAPTLAFFLAELIGAGSADEQNPQLSAARRDPALMAERILESWLEWLRALADRAAILLCVEDLHWADPASVRLIDQALRVLSNRALMVLAFARPEVREAFPNLWSDRDLTEVRLPKLSARQSERVLDGIPAIASDAALRQSLIERADGNPFFLEELVRAYQERPDRAQLPDSILGVVQARLDGLGDDLKLVVRAGSVFGQLFEADGVRALLSSELERNDLPANLRLLVEREVIFPRSASAQEFVFRHGLIRDAAYLMLDSEQRESAHRSAADWLEQRGAVAGVLAEHCDRGAAPERARPYYRAAASDALDAGSWNEVIRFGERAVACGAVGEQLGEVCALMALAYSFSMRDEEGTRYAKLAREHLPTDNAAWWRASQVETLSLLRVSQFETVDARIDEMAAAYHGQPHLLEPVITTFSTIAFEATRLIKLELSRRALALMPAIPDSLAGRAKGYYLCALCLGAHNQGDLAAAYRFIKDAGEVFRSVGALHELGQCLAHAGYFQYTLGAHDEAEWSFLEETQLGKQIGSAPDVGYAAFFLGMLHLRRAQLAEAEAFFQSAISLNDSVGTRPMQKEALAALAELRLLRGDADGADQALARAHALGEVDPVSDSALCIAHAKVQLARGKNAEALAQVEQALTLMREHGDEIESAARIHLLAIECLRACDRREEARSAALEAARWLDKRSSAITDPTLRRSFQHNFQEHQQILQLVAALQ